MAIGNDDSIKHTDDDKDIELQNTNVDEEKTKLDKEKEDEEDIPNHPVDRGWAWVVLAACLYEVFVFGGMVRSYGIFFIQYQARFRASASEITMMNTIQNLFQSFAGLLIMTIWLQRFSTRLTVIIGGLFTVASYLISAFTTELVVFYLAQGVLGGIGLAMVHPPIYAIIGLYFKKHMGLATSIFTAGASLGGLVWAPILTRMLQEYGYTGAMLIVSGLLGNVIVAGLLMRPTDAYPKRRRQRKSSDGEDTNFESGNKLIENNADVNITQSINMEREMYRDSHEGNVLNVNNSVSNERHMYISLQRPHSHDESYSDKKGTESPLLKRVIAKSVGNLRKRTLSESSDAKISSLRKLDKVLDAICRSQVSVFSGSDTLENVARSSSDVVDIYIDAKEKKRTGNCCAKLGDVLKSNAMSVIHSLFDLTLLRNPVFIIIIVMAFCMVSGLPLSPLFIPPFAKDIGISDDRIAMLISIHSVIDLVSRITLAVIADKKLLRRTTILATAAVAIGTAWHLLTFVKTFAVLCVFIIVSGVCAGLYASVYAVIMVEFLGLPKFKSSLGFGTLCHGISVAVFFPIAGRLRDSTGSYIATYHLFGSLAYVGACLAALLPLVHKWNEKRNKKDTTLPQT